jgi:hypothetical protein
MTTQDRCTNLGVRIRHFKPTLTSRGVTVVYRDAANDLIEVSAAICAHADVFKKKIGNEIALDKFERGEKLIIPLPMKEYAISRDDNIHREQLLQHTLMGIFSNPSGC